MTSEFNLSDKRSENADAMYPSVVYCEEDVKEFIRILKENLFKLELVNDEFLVNKIIDKLAGDRLV